MHARAPRARGPFAAPAELRPANARYVDVVGTILRGAGHVHFSELRGDRYLNPLRPGGRVLAPSTR